VLQARDGPLSNVRFYAVSSAASAWRAPEQCALLRCEQCCKRVTDPWATCAF